MAFSHSVRGGILPRWAVGLLVLFILAVRADAQIGTTGSEPWSVPDSLGGDPLKSDLGVPLADNPDEMLSKWKQFEPAPLSRSEGSVVYYNANTSSRAADEPTSVQTPAWKQWLLPGGLTLAGAFVLGLALFAWRTVSARRAALASEMASRYILPANRR